MSSPASTARADNNPHTFQLLQLILFISFHKAVTHDWVIPRIPICKVEQYKGLLQESRQDVTHIEPPWQVCSRATKKAPSMVSTQEETTLLLYKAHAAAKAPEP